MSAEALGAKESVISPNIRENNGIAAPLAKAAKDPIPMSNLSVGVANDRSLEKGTASSADWTLFYDFRGTISGSLISVLSI